MDGMRWFLIFLIFLIFYMYLIFLCLQIRNKATSQCIDSMGRKSGEKVGLVQCHGMGGNQVSHMTGLFFEGILFCFSSFHMILNEFRNRENKNVWSLFKERSKQQEKIHIFKISISIFNTNVFNSRLWIKVNLIHVCYENIW